MEKIIITIPNERPMSWNTLYSGKHWKVRGDEADRVHALVRSYLHKSGFEIQKSILDRVVDIEIRAYFEKRPIDSDNICAKFYIDGLKEVLLHDDSPKYVRSTKTMSLVDKNNPRVEIEL